MMSAAIATAAAAAAPPAPPRLAYDPRGGARALLFCRDREILLEGPANTGKSLDRKSVV